MIARSFVLVVAALLALTSSVCAADASRIVSIGGAVTEILYALGTDKNVVGIDSTSSYPPRAMAEKPNVGYMRQLSAEGVLGLRPSLIIASEGSGPKETMDVLRTAKVPIVTVPETFTGEGIVEKVRVIAQAVDAADRGQCLIDVVRADLDMMSKLRNKVAKPKRVMFVLSLIGGRAMVSGGHTAADGIIQMAGAVNAVTGYDGYKTLTDEAVISTKPDVILSIERGGPSPVSAGQIFALPAFSATPAAATRKFIAMDGLYLLGFGPRTMRAARELTLSLYPELRGAAPAANPVAKQCPE